MVFFFRILQCGNGLVPSIIIVIISYYHVQRIVKRKMTTLHLTLSILVGFFFFFLSCKMGWNQRSQLSSSPSVIFIIVKLEVMTVLQLSLSWFTFLILQAGMVSDVNIFVYFYCFLFFILKSLSL